MESRLCRHCGTPFQTREPAEEFCCRGCAYVFALIGDKGLDKFYDLKSGKSQPVGSAVFHPRDFRWLIRLASALESGAQPGGVCRLRLGLQGISCVGCVWLVERIFAGRAGAVECRVNASSGAVDLAWTAGACDLAGFADELRRFGYLLGPARAIDDRESGGLLRRLGLCAAFAMNTMLFTLPGYLGMEQGTALAHLFETLAFLLATASLVVGGSYFFQRTWRSLRAGILHIDLPISLGLLIAYAACFYAWRSGDRSLAYVDFVAVFTFLMLGGRWLQERAIAKNRRELLEMRLDPDPVQLLTPAQAAAHAGTWERRDLPAGDLRKGMRFAVAPGSRSPVRARVGSPQAVCGLAWITGEPESRVFECDSIAPAGALNVGAEEMVLLADEDWRDSMLAALLRVESRDPGRNPGLERGIRRYLVAVVAVAAIGAGAWFAAGAGWTRTLQVLVSVLVVSCPCAIGVALPLASEMAVSRLRKRGVFVRVGDLWPRLARVTQVVFDKTGTLTLDTLAPVDRSQITRLPEEAKQILLRMVESSLHPVSACLREELLAAGVRVPDTIAALPVREEIGLGLEAAGPCAASDGPAIGPLPGARGSVRASGDVAPANEGARTEPRAPAAGIPGSPLWRLGRPGWAAGAGDAAGAPPGSIEQACVLTRNGREVAEFSFVEEVRPQARDELVRLTARGLGVVVLSGDRPARVRELGASLGLPDSACLGGLLPREKEEWILSHGAGTTLMLGDGANDSLAFDAALCTGTPAVDRGLLENKADFYFLGRSLAGVGAIFDLAGQKRRAVRAVLAFTIAYNLAAIAICLAGLMNPLVAAILMPLSAVVSVAIVARLLRERGPAVGRSSR